MFFILDDIFIKMFISTCVGQMLLGITEKQVLSIKWSDHQPVNQSIDLYIYISTQ